MKVEFDVEEAWALMSCIVGRLAEESDLSDGDRARVRRWRSEEMKPGGDSMKLLTQKIDDDLARLLQTKQRSQIRRPDWR